ncbi:CapA family protein [Mesorhizobium sp. NPDC059054]|uniref:CapA family protein n=1 Tax=Mesorhizobium sp. NPDC059054 TaxID=3346711 RepID=UPI0036CAF71C
MSSPFTLALTGQSLIHHDLRQVGESGFAAIRDLIRSADVSFTNLETTIYGRHGGWPLKGFYFGCSQPVVLDSLRDLGFDALALSNNHAFDLGPSGVLSTLEEVQARGFLHAGIGADAKDARRAGFQQFDKRMVALVAMDAGPGPSIMYADNAATGRPARPGVNRLAVSRVFEVNDEKFGHLRAIQDAFASSDRERASYAQPNDPVCLETPNDIDFYGTVFRRAGSDRRRLVVDEASLDGQLATIRQAAATGAFVIAYLHHHHWEPRWNEVPEWVRSFARSCIDAGANAFASHGAPVLQAIEIYRRAPVFYGLGNFLFHLPEGENEWSSPEIWQSVVATCSFDANDELQSIELLPIVIGGEQMLCSSGNYHERIVPVPASPHLSQAMLEDLSRRSKRYGTCIAHDGRVIWPEDDQRSAGE